MSPGSHATFAVKPRIACKKKLTAGNTTSAPNAGTRWLRGSKGRAGKFGKRCSCRRGRLKSGKRRKNRCQEDRQKSGARSKRSIETHANEAFLLGALPL